MLALLDRADMVCFGDGPTSESNPCLIADCNDLDPDEDAPAEAIGRGWETALLKEEKRRLVLANHSSLR